MSVERIELTKEIDGFGDEVYEIWSVYTDGKRSKLLGMSSHLYGRALSSANNIARANGCRCHDLTKHTQLHDARTMSEACALMKKGD